MTAPGRWDFDEQYGENQTHPLLLDLHTDLTGIAVEFRLAYNRTRIHTATIGDGVTVEGNSVTIAPFEIPNPSHKRATYVYELRLDYPDGTDQTVLTGQMPVIRSDT